MKIGVDLNRHNIIKNLSSTGYYYFDSDISSARELYKFGLSFGKLMKIKKPLLQHQDCAYINVVKRKKNKKVKKNYFGDIWHADHAYLKKFPKYTIMYCKNCEKNAASTFLVNRFDIIKKLKKNQIKYLKNFFYLQQPKDLDHNFKKKMILKRKVKGVTSFNGKLKLEISPYHCVKSDNVIKSIFKKLDDKSIIKKIKIKKNLILIWNNSIVFHKAEKKNQNRVTYRMLVR